MRSHITLLSFTLLIMHSFCGRSLTTAFAFYRKLSFHYRNPSILRGGATLSSSEEIATHADQCLSHSISTLVPSTFGGIPYLSTSSIGKKHRALFILGGPGAGKGTQCANILEQYKALHFSVGELLRNCDESSPHYSLIHNSLVKGQIVPVKISLELLKAAMNDGALTSGYGNRICLVDGFPRNFDNLVGWIETMPPHAVTLGVLSFNCPEDVLEQRILSRGETSGRSDDNLASIKKRFHTFQTQTLPVVKTLERVEELKGNLKVRHIEGEKSLDEVWDEVQSIMDDLIKDDVLTMNEKLIQAINAQDVKQYQQICHSKLLFSDEEIDVKHCFEEYELLGGDLKKSINVVQNAEIEVFNGTEAVVSYDRIVKDDENGNVLAEMRETRVWHHEKAGWVNVHFSRKNI